MRSVHSTCAEFRIKLVAEGRTNAQIARLIKMDQRTAAAWRAKFATESGTKSERVDGHSTSRQKLVSFMAMSFGGFCLPKCDLNAAPTQS